MRKKTRKRKSGKGKIIRNYREFIEKDGADFSPKTTTIPHSKTKGKGSGIYALYDNHGLYYVGLTTSSLRTRIKKHTRNRHKGKWNRFSWYQIPNLKYTKDMESAILRIINPKGNKVKGKLKKRKL